MDKKSIPIDFLLPLSNNIKCEKLSYLNFKWIIKRDLDKMFGITFLENKESKHCRSHLIEILFSRASTFLSANGDFKQSLELQMSLFLPLETNTSCFPSHNCLASTRVINNRTLCAVRFPLNLVQNHDLRSSRETVRSFTNCSRQDNPRSEKSVCHRFCFHHPERKPFLYFISWKPELHILSSNVIARKNLANWWMTQ
jgi:hypothetical protein